ncbi:MAG: 50S ribosomal protein L9 [Pantoea sp. Brub]|nr:50S ribosomal protein L9 [Pantoea sp. Brub]
MKVIMLNNITGIIGDIGDIINVRAGYARNYLIPTGKAIIATKQNTDKIKLIKAELEAKLNAILSEAKIKREKIHSLTKITISSKAGNKGKLFGSVGAKNIANVITSKGIQINKNEIRLPNGVLRHVGEHEIGIQLHSKVFAKLIVNVVDS